MPCCSCFHKTNFNGNHMQFFRIPVERNLEKTKIRRGKDGMRRRKKNETFNKQRTAWFKASERSSKSESAAPDVSENLRVCITHFYPSVPIKSDGNKCSLKTGDAPTTCLTKSSFLNEEFKETNSLPRFVAS